MPYNFESPLHAYRIMNRFEDTIGPLAALENDMYLAAKQLVLEHCETDEALGRAIETRAAEVSARLEATCMAFQEYAEAQKHSAGPDKDCRYVYKSESVGFSYVNSVVPPRKNSIADGFSPKKSLKLKYPYITASYILTKRSP